IRMARFEGGHVERYREAFAKYLGKRPWELGFRDDAGNTSYRAVLDARLPFRDVILNRAAKDGTPRYVRMSGEPIFDGNGRFLGYRGIGRDITPQRQVEQATLRLGRMYATLSATNEAILRAQSADELYEKVCEAAVDGGKFVSTSVVVFEEGSPWAHVVASRGVGGDQLRAARVSLDPSRPEGRGLVGTAFRARKSAISNDYLTDPRMAPWREMGRSFGVASSAAIPLVRAAGQAIGVLLFYSTEKNAFDDEIVKLLERMAENVAFALDNFDRNRERKLAEQALRESEERFKSLTALSSDWFWEQDEEYRFTMLAYSQASTARYPVETVLRRRRWELAIYPDMTDADWAPLKQAQDARQPFQDFLIRGRRPDGQATWSMVSGLPVYDAQGNFKGYRGTGRDVTDRVRAEADMRKLSGAIEQTADCVMITDRDGTIEYVNAAFERTTGYTAAEAVGQKPSMLKSGVHGESFYERLWTAILAGETFSDVFVNRKKDGEVYYEEKTISPLRDSGGRVTHFIATGRDITERMQAQERLQHIAHHDALTGLPNRVLFLDRLNQALLRAQWQKRVVGVMFLDLDRFKNINDTLGHDTGDALLKAMAARLKGCVRASDSVARLGGDEFAVLLEDVAHAEDISTIAGKMLGAFTLPFAIQGHELFISASIGISMYPTDGTTPATLLKNADAAMYRAKDLGKNNYQFYSADMSAAAFERLTLESSLRRALEREEFVLHYQPQIDLTTGDVVAVEALIRWQHPEFGLLAPTQFISIAEETGSIVPVGEWVARKAMVQVRRWREAGMKELRAAVNVSGRQFNEPHFVDMIAHLLEETGLPPDALELEITESVIMKNAEKTVARLRALHAMGVRFAIDDFGTGYSSLSYLRRFAIHTLKVDKSFIRDITADSGDVEIVKTIIMMARGLKLSVIAEGVETREQLVFLKSHGCHAVQGNLVARPLPAERLNERLVSGRPWLP
ncbi:MAG: EAL domain-containing protein, partial [Sulfurifustis sp.]